jgi:hypothetical protein
MLEDLYFHEDSLWRPDWKDNVENRQWLELLRPFMAVKNLYLSEEFASRIPALQELVEGRTTDVLPALQNIFLAGRSRSVQETIGRLVAPLSVPLPFRPVCFLPSIFLCSRCSFASL